ncbi:MAG: site-specific DNA-methyltransferase, partial [Anaerolineales bacterium]|nr:site-specific DNA-methyltransferase [Anaerolineales bacterium]
EELRQALLPYCRLQPGDVWEDAVSGHRVGCLDAANSAHVAQLMAGKQAQLAIHDPPYNLVAFAERPLSDYIDWCRQWVQYSWDVMADPGSLYIWLGADQRRQFQPLPDFMIMMRSLPFEPRSFITLRNQRGYGTQKNWMAVRQELLYYTKGQPPFVVQYTEIPKAVRGYYKTVNGRTTENIERSKSDTIRAGNVWIDIQQVFYRMEENVSGCYAQKPLKAIERIIAAGSDEKDTVLDFFSHSGTTLLAAERLQRRCFTMDIDPLYCEITIRRLERWRSSGKVGWQNGHPFEEELKE